MAIHPHLPNQSRGVSFPTSLERVEAWTVEQAADALSTTSLSAPIPLVDGRSTATTGSVLVSRSAHPALEIPLDDQAIAAESLQDAHHYHATAPRPRSEAVHTVYKRREPIRRDSLKRREALLKGKEGSRRRQRWENDRLLSNPHAEPPLPGDWEVRPTYPVQRVPYFLAPLWDAEYARRAQRRSDEAARATAPASKEEALATKVRNELKARMKRSRAAKGLLQDLEEEVRGFVRQWEEKQAQLEHEGVIDPDSSDDEEIVFVGRDCTMSDERSAKKQNDTLEKDKLIFQSLLDDHGAAFGRYLVHSIAAYYDLKTWSVTTGNVREAYVGLKIDPKTRRPSLTKSEMPQPLYALV